MQKTLVKDTETARESLCTIRIVSANPNAKKKFPETMAERASALILTAFADLVDEGLIAVEVEHWEQGKTAHATTRGGTNS